eukprot:scaffold145437_cov18-Tisochrysis_lutea.AAC.1
MTASLQHDEYAGGNASVRQQPSEMGPVQALQLKRVQVPPDSPVSEPLPTLWFLAAIILGYIKTFALDVSYLLVFAGTATGRIKMFALEALALLQNNASKK